MKTKKTYLKTTYLRLTTAFLLFLFAIAAAVSCGGGGGGGGGGNPGGGGGGTGVLTSIAVTPRDAAVLLDGLRQFTATGTYSDSSKQDITNQVTWSSSNTSVATVSTGGSVTGISVGTTTITAALSSVSGNTMLTVSATALPRTGQTKCYNSSGVEISCTGTGQDGELQKGASWTSTRFTLSGGCMIDNLTGLMWIPNPDSTLRVWTGTGDVFTYVKSLNTCSFTDWRVPNKRELRSLVNYAEANPSAWLIGQGFSNVKNNGSEYYWSSTSSWFANEAFRLTFYDGQEFGNTKTQHYTWPVRTYAVYPTGTARTGQTKCYNSSGVEITPCTGTGQDGELQTGAVWPDPRFTNLDGSVPLSGDVVVDRLTGLIWTKDANKPGPAACYPGITGSQQQALNYIACLNTNQYLGYSDWRLPNINELESHATAGTQDTASYLAAQGFTNVQTAMPYWSSTTSAARTDYAWCIPFSSSGNGNVVTGSKSSSYSIWPVRGGW